MHCSQISACTPFTLRRHRTAGFTLIEILVVVVILGILAAIVVPRVMERPGEARVTRAKQDIQGIGLDALVTKPSGQPEAPNWKGPYLDRVAKDPWGRPYQYAHPGQHGDIDISSYGADGKPGGDGEAADIGNWDQ